MTNCHFVVKGTEIEHRKGMKLKIKRKMDQNQNKDIENQNQKTAACNQDTENQNKEAQTCTKDTEKVETKEEKKEETTEDKIEALGNKLAEINDKYLRLYSEFENYRKRTSKEKIDTLRFATEDTIKDILPIVDDYDRAVEDLNKQDSIPQEIKEGLLLVYNKLNNFLTNKGVKPIEAKGQKFDETFHEATAQVPAQSPEQKGMIIDEITKGYCMYDKVIRFAKVVVAI